MAESKPKRTGPGRPKDDQLAARRRADIVRHAIDEFARRGYAGADLDVIAANAACSKGTLYNYFRSKGDLFSASVDHVMFGMKQAVGTLDDDRDPIDQLENLVRGFLRHFAKHPQHIELLVQERSDFRDRAQPTYYTYRAASRRQWRRRFERLIAEGRMRPMPPGRAINILGDLLYGTIFMNHIRGRRTAPDRQAAEVLDVLLGGLLTDSEFRARRKRTRPRRPAANAD
jgi:AcrR family transcriptional regulator